MALSEVACLVSWAVGTSADGAEIAVRLNDFTVLMRTRDAEEFAAALTSELEEIQRAEAVGEIKRPAPDGPG